MAKSAERTESEKAQIDLEFVGYFIGLIVIAVGTILFFAYGGRVPQLSSNPPTFTPTPKPTPSPGTTPSPGATGTPFPSGFPVSSATPYPSGWPTPTYSPTGTPEPSPTSSPIASPTSSPTASPSVTPIPGDPWPNVSLIDPIDGFISFDAEVYFYCTATDNYEVKNVSLYTNGTGAWTSACSADGASLECTTNFAAGYYEWACAGVDNSSQTGWSERRHFEVID